MMGVLMMLSKRKQVLSTDDLRTLCIKHQWFTAGDTRQYEKLFEELTNGAGVDTLATIIWICSSNATKEEILNILLEEAKRIEMLNDIAECLAVKEAIESDIVKGFDGLHYNDDLTAIIDKYGSLTVELVLAITVQVNIDDGRYSPSNKKWANTYTLSLPAEHKRRIAITSHSAIVNGIIDKVRKLENKY